MVLVDFEVVFEPEPDRVPDSDRVPEAESVSSESDALADADESDAVLEAEDSVVVSSLLFPELVLSLLSLSLFCRLSKALSPSDQGHAADAAEKSSRKAKTVWIRPEARILTDRIRHKEWRTGGRGLALRRIGVLVWRCQKRRQSEWIAALPVAIETIANDDIVIAVMVKTRVICGAKSRKSSVVRKVCLTRCPAVSREVLCKGVVICSLQTAPANVRPRQGDRTHFNHTLAYLRLAMFCSGSRL